MKRAVCFFLAVSAMTLLTCSPSEKKKDTVILLLVKTQDNPFFQDIIRGAQMELRGQGSPVLDIRSGSKEGDVSSQRQILEEYLTRYVASENSNRLKGVLITPSGSNDELTPYLKRLNEAKVPVGIIDTRISQEALSKAGAQYSFFIGSSNRQGGELAANVVLGCAPQGGNVLLLNGVDGHQTATDRKVGFRATLPPKYAVTERTCNWRRDEARAAMDGLLALGRSFDAIFAANDEMALGVIEALRQYPNLPRPKVIVGFDAIPEARSAVRDHRLTATIAQDPLSMGQSAVRSLMQINNGKNVEKEQVIPVKVEALDECARPKA